MWEQQMKQNSAKEVYSRSLNKCTYALLDKPMYLDEGNEKQKWNQFLYKLELAYA